MATLKVLIVEDSELVSDILTEILQSDNRIRVVGVARNGVEALQLVPRLKPDLITMDVWMPQMDGFATVEHIMAHHPTPILVITATSLKSDVEVSLRMLAAGALDVIEKPSFQDEKQWERISKELVNRVHLLAGVRVVTHLKGRLPTSHVAEPPVVEPPAKPKTASPSRPLRNEDKATKPLIYPAPTANTSASKPVPTTPEQQVPPSVTNFPAQPFYQLVAIASSTGGPSALLKVLQNLPKNFPVPIIIVQHISQGFTHGLVEWLQREIVLKVKIAKSGDQPQNGCVYITPDRHNIVVVGSNSQPILSLNTEGEDYLRPNADVMMQSVAKIFGERAIGVVLTGMGSDGAKGLKEMANQGAFTIAQNEATSLIYGMPRAAAENGAAKEILPLGQIPLTLTQLLQQSSANFPTNDSKRNFRAI